MRRADLPWPEKHRPKSMDLLVGNHDVFRSLQTWVESWTRGSPAERAALLIGPPGTGKTAVVGALSHDLDLELVEFNSSDKRNKGSIETLVWRASSQDTLDGRDRIVLLDEVDGLSGTSDRGGVGAILKVLNDSVHPIIMTANNPESPRLKDLLRDKRIKVFYFEPLPQSDIVKVLGRISKENGVKISEDALNLIADGASGDLRAAIADLEAHAKSGSGDEVIETSRDVRRGKQETISRFFMSTDPEMARSTLSESELDHDSIMLLIEENLHRHLLQPDELEHGFDALSLADLSLGRIMRSQNWRLLAYMYDFLAKGVATSRTKTPFRKLEYSDSKWPLLVWKGNRARDKQSSVLRSISNLADVSQRRARRTHLDTIHKLIQQDPSLFTEFAEWLGVDKRALKQ
jgi:replication factor C large subunit